MNTLYNIEITQYMFIQLINHLTQYTTTINNYEDIEETVHLIDYLQHEQQRAEDLNTGKRKQWIEWEETLPDFTRYLIKQGYEKKELEEHMKNYMLLAGQEIEEYTTE